MEAIPLGSAFHNLEPGASCMRCWGSKHEKRSLQTKDEFKGMIVFFWDASWLPKNASGGKLLLNILCLYMCELSKCAFFFGGCNL